MKKYFAVSFKYSKSVFCSNIAHAETAEAVAAHYSRYEWVDIREAEAHEVETARRKGMPIVEIETTEAATNEKEETTVKEFTELKKSSTRTQSRPPKTAVFTSSTAIGLHGQRNTGESLTGA